MVVTILPCDLIWCVTHIVFHFPLFIICPFLVQVIEPVLIIAAGLSVQSPFTQSAFSQNEAHSQTIRQELESEHGDPFTILNAFDEWIEVSDVVIIN